MIPTRLAGDADVTFAIDTLELVEGTYKLDVAIHKRDGYRTTTTACSTPSA
jgi:hypothetical protein